MSTIDSAFDVIKRYTLTAPVDVYGLASSLGVKVIEAPLPDGRSGQIEKKHGNYVITVNQGHPSVRKRFTIAHELGHFVLHKDLIGEHNGIFDNRMYRDERFDNHQFETEANKFAASILMPSELITELRSQGCNSAANLAVRLDVSQQAMEFRLQNLGLIQNVQG